MISPDEELLKHKLRSLATAVFGADLQGRQQTDNTDTGTAPSIKSCGQNEA